MSNKIEKFNWIHFIRFLKKNNIIATIITVILSEKINNFTTQFVDSLIIPIIEIDVNNDGKKDIYKLENKIFYFNGIRFTIGKLIVSFIRFVVVSYIIFVFSKIIKKPIS